MAKSILKAVHETAKGLHKAGTMDAVTMREFDALCLPPVKTYSPTQIKRLRTRYKASQARVCGLSEHQPLDRAEVGAGPEEAKWAVPEVVEPGGCTRTGSACLNSWKKALIHQKSLSAVSDRHGILGELYYCHITHPMGPGASVGRSADSILPCHTCHSEANGQAGNVP